MTSETSTLDKIGDDAIYITLTEDCPDEIVAKMMTWNGRLAPMGLWYGNARGIEGEVLVEHVQGRQFRLTPAALLPPERVPR